MGCELVVLGGAEGCSNRVGREERESCGWFFLFLFSWLLFFCFCSLFRRWLWLEVSLIVDGDAAMEFGLCGRQDAGCEWWWRLGDVVDSWGCFLWPFALFWLVLGLIWNGECMSIYRDWREGLEGNGLERWGKVVSENREFLRNENRERERGGGGERDNHDLLVYYYYFFFIWFQIN